MFYQTRDLIARRPMLYDGQDLQVGDRFTPMSEVDATYLISRARAAEAPDDSPSVPAVVVAVEPPALPHPVEVVAELPAEPPAEAPAVESEPETVASADEPAAEAAGESAEAQQATPRRRGRPPRQAVEPDPTL